MSNTNGFGAISKRCSRESCNIILSLEHGTWNRLTYKYPSFPPVFFITPVFFSSWLLSRTDPSAIKLVRILPITPIIAAASSARVIHHGLPEKNPQPQVRAPSTSLHSQTSYLSHSKSSILSRTPLFSKNGSLKEAHPRCFLYEEEGHYGH